MPSFLQRKVAKYWRAVGSNKIDGHGEEAGCENVEEKLIFSKWDLDSDSDGCEQEDNNLCNYSFPGEPLDLLYPKVLHSPILDKFCIEQQPTKSKK